MIRNRQSHSRHAATVVECAIILPVTFFLLFSIIIGAMGIFRYQEAATLARQGARYASTHGYQYRKDAGQAIGTSSDWKTDIYNNGIAPYIVALDSSKITSTITWPDVVNQPGKPDNWPGSKVTVEIDYQWMPELYLIGPINLTSTSSMPITN
ncbi:MAG: TadE/TadG family type IV pilus assembly protein [Gemmataceae bacterium]